MYRFVGLLWLVLMLGACSPQALLVRGVADQLAGQGQADEEDLLLARDASPFYLKLSESVLRKTPGHLPLAEAVAGGFTQYAFAFVAFEADRVEATNTQAAQVMRARAAQLYWRANRHAMTALQAHQPRLAAALAAGQPVVLATDQVGVAYWAAASWGAYISLSKDKPDVVADLPLVIALARAAYQVNPQHGAGALASLMATLEVARPGGSKRQAQAYFDQALAAGAGREAGVLVSQAEVLALPAGDRPGFEALLRQAIATATQHKSLGNQAMRERAQWLLDTVDDRF